MGSIINPKVKNVVILLTELAAVFLMVLGILPRELGLFLTGLLVFYFIFSPIEDSLWIFIASIPLFVALPITENFDTMANWRILLAVLFLVWLVKMRKDYPLSIKTIKLLLADRLFTFVLIFLLIGLFSLLVATDVTVGIKKILFLINIFLLFVIIRNLATKNKEVIPKIIKAVKVAIGLTLGIGFLQLLMVFFINLHQFWHLWDRQVINVFYGQALSNLLSYSNTWFSYYAYQLPTLRMFSVFPDSHSFALFCILALPFFLLAIFLPSDKNKAKKALSYFLLIICLLAIIFSGTRGAWVSAIGTFFIFLIIIFLYYSPTTRSLTNFFIPRFYKSWQKQLQLILGSLLIFFLLFPLASTILFLPQYIQLGRQADLGEVSLFERARSIIDLAEASIRGRLEIWQMTVNSIIKRPLLGVGIGNFPVVVEEELSSAKRGASAHNLYLDVAAEMGVFALMVLLVIFWLIFKKAWQLFLKNNRVFFRLWAGFFVLALIWILGYSLFDVVLLNDKVLLFFMVNLGILYGTKSTISFRKSSHL